MRTIDLKYQTHKPEDLLLSLNSISRTDRFLNVLNVGFVDLSDVIAIAPKLWDRRKFEIWMTVKFHLESRDAEIKMQWRLSKWVPPMPIPSFYTSIGETKADGEARRAREKAELEAWKAKHDYWRFNEEAPEIEMNFGLAYNRIVELWQEVRSPVGV